MRRVLAALVLLFAVLTLASVLGRGGRQLEHDRSLRSQRRPARAGVASAAAAGHTSASTSAAGAPLTLRAHASSPELSSILSVSAPTPPEPRPAPGPEIEPLPPVRAGSAGCRRCSTDERDRRLPFGFVHLRRPRQPPTTRRSRAGSSTSPQMSPATSDPHTTSRPSTRPWPSTTGQASRCSARVVLVNSLGRASPARRRARLTTTAIRSSSTTRSRTGGSSRSSRSSSSMTTWSRTNVSQFRRTAHPDRRLLDLRLRGLPDALRGLPQARCVARRLLPDLQRLRGQRPQLLVRRCLGRRPRALEDAHGSGPRSPGSSTPRIRRTRRSPCFPRITTGAGCRRARRRTSCWTRRRPRSGSGSSTPTSRTRRT